MTNTDLAVSNRRAKLPDLWAAILRRRANRRMAWQLNHLNDYLLKDVGLTRADLDRLK